VHFDTSDWIETMDSPTRIEWVSADKAADLSLDVTQSYWPVDNDQEMVRSCRALAERNGGGLISAERAQLGPVSGTKLIYKRHLRPRGYVYTGMLIVPTRGFLFVIVMVSGETGMTGVRDALVTGKLAREGKLEFEFFESPQADHSSGRIKGWFQDPFDPMYKGPVLRTIADDEQYDSLCPNDPLSKVRRSLLKIQTSFGFDNA